jgi:hypothetical protein
VVRRRPFCICCSWLECGEVEEDLERRWGVRRCRPGRGDVDAELPSVRERSVFFAKKSLLPGFRYQHRLPYLVFNSHLDTMGQSWNETHTARPPQTPPSHPSGTYSAYS